MATVQELIDISAQIGWLEVCCLDALPTHPSSQMRGFLAKYEKALQKQNAIAAQIGHQLGQNYKKVVRPTWMNDLVNAYPDLGQENAKGIAA